jgi:uncharacterized protein
MSQIDPATMQALEAAAFRRLRDHLMVDRPEVQNIDMMNLAGFCRNCLGRWMHEAAVTMGVDLPREDARTLFYGMPYEQWKTANQATATSAQKAAFDVAFAANVTKPD